MSVRCGRTARAKPYPSLPGYEVIPAWSRGRAPYKQLSPMLLGPVIVNEPLYQGQPLPGFMINPNGQDAQATVKIFENYWQGSKIYKVDLINPNNPVELNNLKPEFFRRRAEIFSSDKAIRRALPKAKYGVPISSFYGGYIMDYITSRKLVYCPYYYFLTQNHPVYLQIKNLHQQGQNLIIVGPDGYDENVELNREKLSELLNRTDIIFGHELVLCCMLLNYLVWQS